jgi:hypothetical protein
MKPRFLLPALAAAAAAGGALYSLEAKDLHRPRAAHRAGAEDAAQGTRHGDLLSQFRQSLIDQNLIADDDDQDDADKAPAPRQRQFRYEFRNDGSGPRFFRDGKEIYNL